MTKTIGTCSWCGGAVVVCDEPDAVPTCLRCKATKKGDFGPVIQMENPQVPIMELRTITTTGGQAAWPCQATDPVQHTDAVGGEGCKATTSEIKP